MRQYKDLAFRTLINKNISSFRDESTAAYISALTNDAASVEANYLTQQLSLITKAVTFFGAFIMMLFYSPLMTAIAAALTVLPFIASLLTGGRLEAAERRVSDCNRDFTAALSDCLAGFSVVKSFKAEKEIFELFARSNRALEKEKFGREHIVTIVGMIGAITAIFAQLGVFIAGAYFALNGYGLTPGAGVAESLQQARQYADELEAEYGVRILLFVQCRETAALCDHAITLTDTMGQSEELSAVNAALGALKRSLSLYPEGFFAQFKHGMGEGGVRILLIEQIESNYGAIGCTYENGIWQNIALDVRTGEGMDGIICHEIWHATENHILTKDYSAILPDEWNALNPEGFEYYWDATLVNNAHEWTLYSGNIANVYFVDSYACVDEKEDRARIMEYFMTHDDEAELLIQSPAIRKKLELMCRAIRSTFDTSSWENVRWERLL